LPFRIDYLLTVIPDEPRGGEIVESIKTHRGFTHRPILLDPGSRPDGAGLGRDDGNDLFSG
jgi:hypothetical protein